MEKAIWIDSERDELDKLLAEGWEVKAAVSEAVSLGAPYKVKGRILIVLTNKKTEDWNKLKDLIEGKISTVENDEIIYAHNYAYEEVLKEMKLIEERKK